MQIIQEAQFIPGLCVLYVDMAAYSHALKQLFWHSYRFTVATETKPSVLQSMESTGMNIVVRCGGG